MQEYTKLERFIKWMSPYYFFPFSVHLNKGCGDGGAILGRLKNSIITFLMHNQQPGYYNDLRNPQFTL